MTVLRQAWIVRRDLRAHPDWLYLYGDNEARVGHGGQAAFCRGEPNAVGVATKRAPRHTMESYWTDADFERVKPIIDRDLAPAFAHVAAGGTVVVPADGLGTGMAQLPQRAPRILRYIEDKLTELAELELEQEAGWFGAVAVALREHKDANGKMSCPICGNEMEALRRPRRQTFAGWEDACIQVHCETCLCAGEFVGEEP